MRKTIRESIMSVVNDLHQSGIIDEVTQREMENLCLPVVKNYSPPAMVMLNIPRHGFLGLPPPLRQRQSG